MTAGPSLRRRALLAGTAGTLTATSGCVGDLRNLLGRESTQQMSLTIAAITPPADPYAVPLANRLSENLQAAGIDAIVDQLIPDVLFRDVLVNQDFDIYVTRYPGEGDPDELRTLLHSSYGEEVGWQNPFGFSNLRIDELLEEQRGLAGEERQAVVHELLAEVVREQPFTTVAFPDRIAGYRTDRFDRWPAGGPTGLPGYLMLREVGETDTVELALGDPRITRNRNPIAVEHRSRGHLTDLMYEPLVRSLASTSEPTPWLARDVTWDETARSATVTLRSTDWHDGEPVTADDVAFTYEFLNDTSLGGFDTPVPTPWRRGRVSLVESARVVDDETVTLEFVTSVPEVAVRALRVPVLPEHIWSEQTDRANLAGIDVGGPTTNALVWSNDDPVGSGPLQFESATTDEELVLTAFEDHFLRRGDDEGIPETFTGELPFEEMVFTVVPSPDAAVETMENGDADSVADSLSSSVASRVLRTDGVSLTISRSGGFYHVGYNCRNAPLSDPHFRRVLARLLDRDYLVADTFEGYADPTEAPLKRPWTPDDLAWDEEATLPFFGDDGDLDVEAVRETLRDAGYQYEDDRVVSRGEG